METTTPIDGFSLTSAPRPKKQKRLKPGDQGYISPNAKAAKARAAKANAIQYVDAPPATQEEESFRHEHWKKKRRRVRDVMTQCGATANRLASWDNCGSECTVEYEQTLQKYRVRANYCKNRNCEPCMKAKANLLAANLEKHVEDLPGKQFRFITLTLKHSDEPLTDQLTRLNECFKKLRSAKCWKSTQDGGAAMLEVKYSRDTGEWHPHLHIVAQGYYLAQHELSDAWYAITKDSFKVDIRVIKSPRDAARYVAKYVSKGVNDDVWAADHTSQEWLCSMKGRRLCATFGCWRGFKLLGRLPDEGEWKPIGTLTEIMRAANRADLWAVKLIDALRATIQYNPHRPRNKGDKTQ